MTRAEISVGLRELFRALVAADIGYRFSANDALSLRVFVFCFKERLTRIFTGG